MVEVGFAAIVGSADVDDDAVAVPAT